MSTPSDGEIRTVADALEVARAFGEPRPWGEPPGDVGYGDPNFTLGIWYRGHADPSSEPLPAVHRDAERKVQDETSILYHFQALSPHARPRGGTTFGWLSLMRHHRFPTRLLDWSESILVALYFAVEEEPSREGQAAAEPTDGRLFVLNAWWLNTRTDLCTRATCDLRVEDGFNSQIRAEQATVRTLAELFMDPGLRRLNEPIEWTGRSRWSREVLAELGEWAAGTEPVDALDAPMRDLLYRLRAPIGVFPKRRSPRMTAQYSMFTLHGGKQYAPWELGSTRRIPAPVPLEQIARECRCLRRFRIPGEAKEALRRDLQKLGIHAATMFPDMEGYSRYVASRWSQTVGTTTK